MAAKGTSKWFSEQHESKIAWLFGGERSRSSGAAVHDQGDVRVQGKNDLIECKHTGSFAKPAKSISLKLAEFEKIAREAYSEAKRPALALRIYAPDSIHADSGGYVDFIARLVYDDLYWEDVNG